MENITFLSTMVPEQENTLTSGPEMLRLGCAIPLLLVATFGNVMSFIIMRRKSMKRSSPGIYFAACTDTSTVYWGLVPFVVYYFTSVDLWTLHPWSCKIIIFMLFSSADSAIWLLVAVTVDRFIAVRFPMKKSRLCTPRKATCMRPAIHSHDEKCPLFFHQRKRSCTRSAATERPMGGKELWISNPSY